MEVVVLIEQIKNDIQMELKKIAPSLAPEKKSRMCNILNSENPNFECYGLTIAQIEEVAKSIFKKYEATYEIAVEVFKKLISSDIHDEKFTGVF